MHIEKEKDFSTILSSFNTIERFFSFEYFFSPSNISLSQEEIKERKKNLIGHI
jgi:hypothetical protein